MRNLKDELSYTRIMNNIIQKNYCTKEEQKEFSELKKQNKELPQDVKHNGESFFRYSEVELEKDELNELLTYKKLGYLRTIKNCSVFFVIVTVINILLAMISWW